MADSGVKRSGGKQCKRQMYRVIFFFDCKSSSSSTNNSNNNSSSSMLFFSMKAFRRMLRITCTHTHTNTRGSHVYV